MLQILPALILMILNGPSHAERWVEGTRQPSALESATVKLVPDLAITRTRGQERALHALLSLSGSSEVAEAIMHLISMHVVECRPGEPMLQPVFPAIRTFGEPPTRAESDCFAESQRSRDGPSTR